MNKKLKAAFTVLNIICISVIMTYPVYAYIDPATTSYVIQIVAGIIIVAGAGIGIFWNKIKRAFKKKSLDSLDSPEVSNSESKNKEEKIISANELLDDEDKD